MKHAIADFRMLLDATNALRARLDGVIDKICTLLMAATTNGAAITRTGHNRNIRLRDYYLRRFSF